jgi:hypothetical protein
MNWLSLVVLILSLGALPLSIKMARARARSPRLWFWIAFLVGPLAPLLLVMLGRRDDETAASATTG